MKLLVLLMLAVLLVSMPLSALDKPAPVLSVEISAPARYGTRALELGSIPVVVANRSAAEVRIWREWCSWGWFQLSFEFRIAEGKVITVRKKERGWDKNFPDYWTLAPGEPLVLTAKLTDTEVWKWSAPLADVRGKSLEVRAVFASKGDEEGKLEGIFCGEVFSTWRKYELH